MKNDKIIASWDKILLDEAADERMLSKIMEYQHSHEKNERVIFMTSTMKKIIPMAACFALMLTVIAFIGVQGSRLSEESQSDAAGSKTDNSSTVKEEESGVYGDGTYSLACFPAERVIEDVANATCTTVSEDDIVNINGLSAYIPSEIPSHYHLELAGLYETTMKDGEVYKALKMTYVGGNEGSADSESGMATLDPDDSLSNFYVSIYDFKPDMSDILSPESISKELISEKMEKGVFCIRYGDCYVVIEPTSLSVDETVLLIKSINS